MAEDDGYRTLVRVIEYHGPVEWLEKTLAASKIPIQGALNLPRGVYIKSGIISWQPDAITEAQVNGGKLSVDQHDQQQPVKTVPFKRPGE